jgi:hypothetical protein
MSEETLRTVRETVNHLKTDRLKAAKAMDDARLEILRLQDTCPHDWTPWKREHDLNDDHGRDPYWRSRTCRACDKREEGSAWG